MLTLVIKLHLSQGRFRGRDEVIGIDYVPGPKNILVREHLLAKILDFLLLIFLQFSHEHYPLEDKHSVILTARPFSKT